jgi:hypothetical protein
MLPNPFESLPNGVLYNLFASAVLLPITFVMVSFLYEGGSAPAWGSILFFIFYLINTGVLLLCSVFNFATVACVIIGVVYFVLFIGLVTAQNRFGRGCY